ncbi:hypothetical protein ABIA33_006334 [Streptacidiphilus sp. MAP12-16]|uniref:glycosyl hydrolase n=1 Tax=Streptacidiphilus sp. MAP12-16 TaxID=3156300 RepID=UPI00351657AA
MSHARERERAGPRRPVPRTLFLALFVVVVLLLLQLLHAQGPARGSGTGRTTGAAADPCAATRLLAPPCGAWWGAYVPPGPQGLAASVAAFERRAGRRLDIVYAYHDMGPGTDGQLLTPDERSLGRNHLLMLSWESDVWGAANNGSASLPLGWKKVAAGDYDATIIDPGAERIKAYGKPILLSIDQEMDLRTPANGTPADYVAAFRHLHDRFRQLGVTNVVWVWTVTGYLPNAALMSASYPGNAYVDWIAYDQYNYYACKHDPDWESFAQTQVPSYTWLRQHISATKPLMLAEFGTAVDQAHPQTQQQWYQQVPQVVKQQLPGVRAVLQWDSSVPGPDCDLSVNPGPAMAGYAQAGTDPYFHQPLPLQR